MTRPNADEQCEQVSRLMQRIGQRYQAGQPLYELWRDLNARPGDVVVEELEQLLEDRRIWMRCLAAKLLGELNLPKRPLRNRRLDTLVQLFRHAPHLRVRQAAALGLGELGRVRGFKAIIEEIESPDRRMRSTVAWALGRGDSPTTARALIQLSSDEDGEVREWALFGLQFHTRPRKAIIAACRARLDDAFRPARYEAIRTLVTHRAAEAPAILGDELHDRGCHIILAWAVDELGHWIEDLQNERGQTGSHPKKRRR